MILNNINIHLKQLNSYVDYIIAQENTFSESSEIILKSSSVMSSSLDVHSISSSGSSTISMEIGESEYIIGENTAPQFLKNYTSILSEIFNELKIRINKNGIIESFENISEVKSKWLEIKDSIFQKNNYLTDEEKQILIQHTTQLFENPSLLKKEIEDQFHWKLIIPHFLGEDLWLNKETKFYNQSYKSIALNNFSINLNFTTYLEKISPNAEECEISTYGVLDVNTLDYKKLIDLAEKEIFIDEIETYNYFVDLSYIINTTTGFIKKLDAEIEETFNGDILYKTNIYVDAI